MAEPLDGRRLSQFLPQLPQPRPRGSVRPRAATAARWQPFFFEEGDMDSTTILIIVIILLVLGGGWYGRGRWY